MEGILQRIQQLEQQNLELNRQLIEIRRLLEQKGSNTAIVKKTFDIKSMQANRSIQETIADISLHNSEIDLLLTGCSFLQFIDLVCKRIFSNVDSIVTSGRKTYVYSGSTWELITPNLYENIMQKLINSAIDQLELWKKNQKKSMTVEERYNAAILVVAKFDSESPNFRTAISKATTVIS